MTEVGHLLSQSLDATEVSQRVVDHVRRFLKTRAATLYQLEPASGMLIALPPRRLRTRYDAMARAASREGCGGAGRLYPPTRGHDRHPH